MYGYLLINVLILLLTVIASFAGKEKFVESWIFVLPATLVTACFFILWEHYFVVWKIWSFNPDYLSGYYIFSLPLEEVLSLFTLPFAFIFVYEWLNSNYHERGISHRRSIAVSWLIVLFLAGLSYICMGKVYSALAALPGLILLLQHMMVFRKRYYGKFYRAFLVCLAPLILIRAILTSLPVITYDPQQLTGIRIFSMPAEDILYFFFMMLFNLSVYEYAKSGRRGKKLKIKNEIIKNEIMMNDE